MPGLRRPEHGLQDSSRFVDYNTGVQLKVNKRLLYPIFSAVILIAGTYVAIQFAKGSLRVSPDGIVKGSGLLAASSDPKGAQLLIDGRLISATDDTIYLDPKTYRVEMSKDGYTTWTKNMTLAAEEVTQANARLVGCRTLSRRPMVKNCCTTRLLNQLPLKMACIF
jgi:hypothetical protein